MTTARYFSAPEVAKLFGVNQSKPLHWIRTGELPAFNVAKNPLGRPRWRISQADLAIFEARRAAIAPAKTRPRRKTVGVIEFF